jgi:hypothetical protein
MITQLLKHQLNNSFVDNNAFPNDFLQLVAVIRVIQA